MPRAPDVDMDQAPSREGDKEYAQSRAGRRLLLRTWKPSSQRWVYTTLGKRFFARRYNEWVIEIPVVIHTKEGRRRKTRIPYEWLNPIARRVRTSIFDDVNDAARERLKKSILDEVTKREDDDDEYGYDPPDEGEEAAGPVGRAGDKVLLDFSGEKFVYDPTGEWKFSVMSTVRQEDGTVATEVIMHRNMGAPLRPSDVLHPELFVPEAFEASEQRDCVPRQLAAVTGVCREDIDAWFDRHKPGWRAEGLSSVDVEAWCREEQRACYVVHGHRLIHAHVPEEGTRHVRGVAFLVHGDHAYFYTHTRFAAQMQVREPGVPPTERLEQDEVRQDTDVSLWSPWEGQVEEPGEYYSRDLDEVRATFLARGHDPKVTLMGRTAISALHIVLPQGTVIVRHWPDWADELQAFVAFLNREHGLSLRWRGQGLATTTWKALRALLLQRRRDVLNNDQKEALCASQDARCNACGVTCAREDREFDHVVPLHARPGRQEFQMLCRTCHASKSLLEPRANRDPLASCFSRAAFESYADADPLPPLVFQAYAPQARGGRLLEVDVRRCRRNALLHCAHPIPLFSVFDGVKPRTEFRLADMNWIDAGCPKVRGPGVLLDLLPYSGPRWYPHVAASYLLHTGRVTWDHVLFQLDATAHLPPDALKEPLLALERAWEAVKPSLAKLSVNALLGLLSSPRRYSYRLRSSSHVADGRGAALQMVTTYGDREVTDYIFETRVLTNKSHRPVSDIALFTEQVRVAQALYVLKRLGCPVRGVVSVKTDAVIFHAGTKARKAVEAEVGGLRFCDLHELRRRHEPATAMLDDDCPLQPLTSEELVFRLGEGERLQAAPASWRPFVQPPAAPPRLCAPFEDVSPERAEELALSGAGLLVVGIAGTGKTHWAKRLIARLRDAGKSVVVISKTHSAVQNIEGQCTADHFCHRYILHGSCRADTVVVEEVSMIDASIWAELGRLQFLRTQVICLGDFNQFPPIANQWRGTPVSDDAMEASAFLRELCPHRLTLSENRRSDQRLFDWYSSLVPGGSRHEVPLEEVVREARATFPVRPGHPRYSLCLSHKRRIRINNRANLQEVQGRSDAVPVRLSSGPRGVQQDMWLFPGQQLIGCQRFVCAGGVLLNGCFYEVEAVESDIVKLKGGLSLARAQVPRYLRLTHALTMASCQGLTLQGRVRLHDLDSTHFTRRHLFVALSRATAFELVEVR
jgi:hypothetical protein